MIKSIHNWKIIIFGILVLNVILLAVPMNSKHLETSNNFFASWLRIIGLEPQHPDTYHQVPLLTSGTPYSIPHNQSYPKSVNLKLSDYFVPGWADTRWQYRKNITIDSTKVSSNLMNFPVLIDLCDSDLQQDAQVSGNDIFFSDDTGKILDHEIELYQRVYNSSHARLIAWVKANISDTQDTIISLYYGNPVATSQENPSAVWSTNYVGVWHLSESSGNALDSTSYKANGTVTGAIQGVAGQIYGAYDFDGIDDRVQVTDPADGHLDFGMESFSFSLWVNIGLTTVYQDILYKGARDGSVPGYSFYRRSEASGGTVSIAIGDGTSRIQKDFGFSSDTWIYVAGVADRNTNLLHGYKNGVEQGSGVSISSLGSVDSNLNLWFADGYDNANAFIDEVRIFSGTYSTEWIQTEYNNQNDPSTFYSISNKENFVAAGNWAIPMLKYRKNVTILASQVSGSGNLANFPLLVDLYDKDLHNSLRVQNDGDDIIFTDSEGTLLDYELEQFDQTFNSSHAHLTAWVRIPTLSGTQNTVITMYYGNTALKAQQNPSGIWDSAYKGIWHLSEDPSGTGPQILDSTSYNNDGTAYGSMTLSDQIAGKMGGSINFDGIDDYINCSNDNSLNMGSGDFTFGMWFKISTVVDPTPLGGKGLVGDGGKRYAISMGPNSECSPGQLKGEIDDDNLKEYVKTSTRYDNSIWHYVVLVRDGTNLRLYLNGTEISVEPIGTYGNIDSDYPLQIGRIDPLVEHFGGQIDEVRISNIARSADWIKTEYNNQYDPNNFFTISNEEANSHWWADGSFTTRKDILIDKSKVGKSTEILILRPNGVGYSSMLSVSGATNNWEAVDEVNYDSNTYVYYILGTWGSDYYNTENAQSSLSGAIINSVTIKFRGIFVPGTVGVEGRTQLRTHSLFYSGSPYSLGLSYNNIYSTEYQTNPYTGQVWTWAEINDMEIGVGIHGVLIGDEARVTQLWAEVNYTKTENLSNFPVLFDITSNDLKNGKIQPDADDILFTDENGTKLFHEIEYFSQTSTQGHLIVWVKVFELFSNKDTFISMYYGNEALESQESPGALWSTNYVGVWHLSESTGDAKDSTEYGTDGTIQSGATQGITGKIDTSYNFDGTNEGVSIGDPSDGHLDFGANSFTISFWINIDKSTGTYQIPLYKGGISSSNEGYEVETNTAATNLEFGISDGSTRVNSQIPITFDNWIFFVGVINRITSTLHVYKNGIEIGFGNDISSIGNIDSGYSMSFSQTGYPFDGLLDEIRISNSVLSNSWITTEYFNQEDPSSFYTIGPEMVFDNIPPTILDFGVDDSGNGIGKFWADISDDASGVGSVIIKINDTEYVMSYNGTYWIYQKSVIYQNIYSYQIVNASDIWNNFIQTPSMIKYHTFNFDKVLPDVIDWEYYPDLGVYGTFKANVSDNWGEIDTVLVNVTKLNGIPHNDLWAVMRSTASGYMNNTIVMSSGPIYYEIIVNDTAGNTFTSSEHQGFVPIINHPPEVSDITLSRAQSSILLPIYSNSTLYLNYTFYDQDSDDEGGTEIRWYKNAILQSAYNNQKSVPASALFKGDAWNVTVKPKDGQVFGTLVPSETVIVQNTPPKITVVSISPSTPLTTQQLTVTNTTTDNDGDSLTYEVKWFNPSENASYADLVVISSDQTKKGETWWCEVRAWDGSNYSNWKLSNSVTIQNSVPSASSLAITPSSALTTDDLHATYVFTDADNDLESNSYIRWFKNGVEQPAYENLTTIPAAATLKGQNWYFTVQPCDGFAYGTQKQSTVKTIENTPPTANNLQITPISATTGDSLTAAYDYADVDNDSPSGTKVLWYKDGVLQGTLNDSETVSSSYTAKGHVWHFKVQPSDGTDFGIWVSCPVNITIQNTAPSASNLQITPSNAKTSNTLTANYVYTDADGDPQSGSEIIWYRNEVLIEVLNDSTTVDPSYTTKDDSWHFKVRPRDGIDFGVWYSCSINITIANTEPSVSNLEITPTIPITTDILSTNYNFIDADGDPETNSRIRWFKNGIEQSIYENDTSITAAATKKGENWYFKLTPFDGMDYGVEQQSDVVMIENTPPSASNLYINPSDAKTADTLTANYNYLDIDNDIQSGTKILWYKDGVLQGTLNDSITVSSSYTTRGEIWHFKVQPSDGTDFGSWVSCPVNITIQNTAPSASNLQITPSDAKTSNTLIMNYNYFDLDGDPQSGSEIIWYKNGTLMGSLNDSNTVDSSYTTKGDIWHFKVRPSDNFDFGIWYSCPVNLTIGNTPPNVENIQLNGKNTSAQISVNDNLIASYDYYDLDSDAEVTSSLEILWYRNSVLIPALTNCLLVGSTNTTSGEIWYYKIRVHDGTDYSTQESSPSATIEVAPNNPPEALFLNITPSIALTSDSLYINYTFVDADNDSEDGTIYRWYRNGILVPEYVLQTLPASATVKGDIWHVKVRPRDGIDFGNWVSVSVNVTIGNTAPSSSNLVILPSNPVTSTDLQATYIFTDLDNLDTESGSEIRWFKDGVLQGALNDSPSVASSYTAKGQNWHFKVRPSDGTDFGIWVSCPVNITIQNTAPSASTLSITPLNAKTQDNLTANYVFADIDADGEGESYIRWYLDGIEQTSYENQTTISNTVTIKGQIWYFTIQPSDGEDLGIERTSPGLTIRNTAPSLSDLEISPSIVTTLDPLTVLYSYFDVDADPQSGSSIIWYNNGVLQSFLNNSITVNADYTVKGQTWHVKVRPKDGTDFGVWYSCSFNITIGNALPSASNLQISPADAKTTQDLSALYTFSDVDFDAETNSAIIWFVNGLEQPIWENETFIPASSTTKGDIWHFKVCPSDGYDFGTWMSCPENVTIANSLPTASSLQITPSTAMTDDDLLAIYSYFDVDGDTEGLSLIRWYKNGIEQSAYENYTSILSVTTTKGDNWYFTIQPFDGIELGVLKTSLTITITNTPPSADNLQFTPLNPTSNDDLSFSYTFTDPDPDILINLEIRWYCNNILQTTYNDILTIDKTIISKGDQWNLSVRVSDGIDYSEWNNITIIIQNSVPEVVEFSPYIYVPASGLFTTSILIANWEDFDADGDTIVNYHIRWFKYNGTMHEIFDLENNTEVLPSYTTKGDEWRFRVQVFDGEAWSTWSSDAIQIITNSEPFVENIMLSGGVSTTSDIILSYDFYDADNDSESSKIEWKIVHLGSVSTIQGGKTLSSSSFTAGDLIWVVITPDDNDPITGVITGKSVDSSTLSGSNVMKLVGNTAPQINTTLGVPLILSDHPNGSSIYNPQVPIYLNYSDLVYDIDSGESDEIYDINLEQNFDVQYAIALRVSGTLYCWYKFNSTSGTWELQPELTKSFVDPYYLHRDDQWMGSVRPRDQYGYLGDWVNSTSIKIGNSLPEIKGFSWLLQTPTTLDDLTFSFEYFDFDDDPLDLSRTLILWVKNGEVIIGTENTTTLSSVHFQKNDQISVILRPFDGTDWANENFTSEFLQIQNSIPFTTTITLQPIIYNYEEVLYLNWTYNDVDVDPQSPLWSIIWTKNGVIQSSFENQSFINLIYVNNNDLWQVEFCIFDGTDYSAVYVQEIVTKVIDWNFQFNPSGMVDPNIRIDEFYVEDENISLSYQFLNPNDALGTKIQWFKIYLNGSQFEVFDQENQSIIPYWLTSPGELWYCRITPFDGIYYWKVMNSSLIRIENRPEMLSSIDQIITVQNDTECHYLFNIETKDQWNKITTVELSFNETFYETADKSLVNENDWIVDFQIPDALVQTYLNTMMVVEIKIISEVDYSDQIFEIYSVHTLNFTVRDQVAPRVHEPRWIFDDETDPTNITFYTGVVEYGSEISSVTLYYFFKAINVSEDTGNGASILKTVQYTYKTVEMIYYNTSDNEIPIYRVTVPFDHNGTSREIIYYIVTADESGNSGVAYDILRDDPNRITETRFNYTPPGIDPMLVLLITAIVIIIAIFGSIIYVKFIRKPEIVGLDRELVLNGISQISEIEVKESLADHSIGIVIAFFDQRHGPIPIIIVPEMLRDNFNKLVELADRSFSGTGFCDNFQNEIPSSYDFTLDYGVRASVLSFGFALERPTARGGQENLTLNILVHQDLFPLVESFKKELQLKTHEIHLLMHDENTEKDKINRLVSDLRNYVSYIILSYKNIYGTTDLLEED